MIHEEKTKEITDREGGLVPSCFEPHYESEAKCKAFRKKVSFHSGTEQN